MGEAGDGSGGRGPAAATGPVEGAPGPAAEGASGPAAAGPDRHPGLVPGLLLAVLAISFAAIFFRLAFPTHPLVAAGLRLALAAAVLSPGLVAARLAGRLSRPLLASGALAGLLYAVHFGAWVTSLALTSVAASVTLVTATPLLLALVGLATGRDRPDRRTWGALALALVGLALIGGHDLGAGADALAGDALALLGAAAMAGYLLVGRRLGPALDVPAFAALATGVGAVVLLATAALAGVPLALPSPRAALFIALAALVPQLVGHTLLTWALRHTRPAVVGMATVGEPVGAALIGWLWLGEAVAPPVAAGCTLTIAAVLLALREPRPLRPASRPRGRA